MLPWPQQNSIRKCPFHSWQSGYLVPKDRGAGLRRNPRDSRVGPFKCRFRMSMEFRTRSGHAPSIISRARFAKGAIRSLTIPASGLVVLPCRALAYTP